MSEHRCPYCEQKVPANIRQLKRLLGNKRKSDTLIKRRASGLSCGRPRQTRDIEGIIEMRKKGKTIKEIAQQFKVSFATIQRDLKKADL